MKNLKYLWRNVTRNKIRSLLTILSVGFSLALLTVLIGFIVMQGVWSAEAAKHHRLVVMNSMGFVGRVPISYVEDVRKTKGVKDAVQYSWFGGEYKDEKFPFGQFGTDPQHVFNVWDEFRIDPEQLKNWQNNRQGCVVDRRLAEKRGWKIGEKIPLKGTYFPYNLDLELCGIFDTPQPIDSLWFNWDYLNEGLKQVSARATEHAGTIFAKTESADILPSVITAIDESYASSEHPTRSQTEAAFAQMFADMLGDIQTYIRNIGLAVFLSLTLVAGSSMAMAMRERTTEIAVLKAIGFSRARILGLVLSESCVISLLGGAIGIGLGCLLINALHDLSPQFFQFKAQDILGSWIRYLVLIAVGLGLVSGIVPAVRAAQLSVVNGLRRVV